MRDAADLKEHGIGFVAISSNDAEAYPDDSFPEMKLFAQRNGFAFPYLYDEDQTVAKTYGAACTPDFFGFNSKFELQYRGRLDASRREADLQRGLRRDLYEAMTEVARTGSGTEGAGGFDRLLDQVEGVRRFPGVTWPEWETVDRCDRRDRQRLFPRKQGRTTGRCASNAGRESRCPCRQLRLWFGQERRWCR